MKAPKFKANFVICVTTVKKLPYLLFALLQVITIVREHSGIPWPNRAEVGLNVNS